MHPVILPVALDMKLFATLLVEPFVDLAAVQHTFREVYRKVRHSVFLVSDPAVDQEIILDVVADEVGCVIFKQLDRNLVLVRRVTNLQDVNV